MCGPYVEHYKLAIRAAGKQLHISPLDIRTTFAKCPSNWQSSHSVEESNSHSAEHENGVPQIQEKTGVQNQLGASTSLPCIECRPVKSCVHLLEHAPRDIESLWWMRLYPDKQP
ncbi:predicted protein [Sclerotinia sclerotiorum 1980 UF-70]|uniref:Uncharacterized protein n=1 Tax=Sclerotinia sclerotiorum (strain ATCC 18683 / 1980 / Ss-1) TaxID=665079 RepID=A7EKR7_SCLS1|nr:predicted protein [Sclerotinia sclerotiorum 1980 UF-70]EDO03433.1 predicted protein [Sclerotinia sclerotiorum 1980 UF-70]